MKKTQNPWLTCSMGALLMFCTIGLTTTAFAVFQPYLISTIGLSNTQASMVITVRSLCSILAVFAVQKAIDTLGLRRCVSLACLLSAVGFLILSFSGGSLGCYAAAALLGFSYGFGGNVSVSIIIKRSFSSHISLALGICAAATGLAAVVCPPVATGIIKHSSFQHAMWFHAGFITLASAIVFCVLKPSIDKKPAQLKQAEIDAPRSPAEKKRFYIICAAAFLIGTLGGTGWSHLGVLYSTEGASPETVSWLISFVGFSLSAGKLIFGQVTDRLGSRRSSLTFCTILIGGQILACFAAKLSTPLAMLSMLGLGLGLPISSVGFSALATDLSTPAHYSSSIRYFQISFAVGSLVTSPFPGIIADVCGSYVPAFYFLVLFSMINLALIYIAYKIKDGQAE